jgi:hypothetical protein
VFLKISPFVAAQSSHSGVFEFQAVQFFLYKNKKNVIDKQGLVYRSQNV